MIAQFVPYIMTAILLTALMLELKTGRIPNWLTLLPFILFIAVAATTQDRSTLITPLISAAVVFVVGILLFLFAGFGAGAVKLMAGTALYIPLDIAGWTFTIFMLVLIFGTFILIKIRNAFGSEDSNWNVMAKKVMPMTIPIATAAITAFFFM